MISRRIEHWISHGSVITHKKFRQIHIRIITYQDIAPYLHDYARRYTPAWLLVLAPATLATASFAVNAAHGVHALPRCVPAHPRADSASSRKVPYPPKRPLLGAPMPFGRAPPNTEVRRRCQIGGVGGTPCHLGRKTESN